ncbi:MAG: hypothetical protein DRN08_00870 [Thermoplasmata archaeon]|nr:MAG: hypothetical protein DRN08_00870 [Thermoplasmata archaeon]
MLSNSISCKNCDKLFLEKKQTVHFIQMRYPPKAILFDARLYTEFYLSGEECAKLIQDVMNMEVHR